jgi:hypothetical protein
MNVDSKQYLAANTSTQTNFSGPVGMSPSPFTWHLWSAPGLDSYAYVLWFLVSSCQNSKIFSYQGLLGRLAPLLLELVSSLLANFLEQKFLQLITLAEHSGGHSPKVDFEPNSTKASV